MSENETIDKLKLWSVARSEGRITDSEFVFAFAHQWMFTDSSSPEHAFGLIPEIARSGMLEYLQSFAGMDCFDGRHAFINDGMTLEKRRENYRQRESQNSIRVNALIELLLAVSEKNNY